MVRLVLIAALLFGSCTPVYADELCGNVAKISEIIMQNRQDGVSLQDSLRVADTNQVLKDIVLSAYRHPRLSYEPNRIRAIEEFRDEWHLICIDTMKRN